ncbi:HAD-IC family P-type ATPase [Pseudonocardia zijingensis]|uniref:HAD-IC family P-type ATPase n=1 Tax=Pseudonocardia zijingensis TaxID=153376 RepID=UPI0031DF60BD
MTYVKGAPEVLLAHVDADASAAAHQVLGRYAADGLRVLAVARTGGVAADDGPLAAGLELLGLVALIDPPRPGVVEAIEECHRAGISVKMITGDHAATAAAIGRDLGITGRARGAAPRCTVFPPPTGTSSPW